MSVQESEFFGDYIVFVDESGDHGLTSVDKNYPMFVLAFCLFKKDAYIQLVTPALQSLKFHFWGHDEQVLHEHEIRKPNKNYSFLFDATKRNAFIHAINKLISEMPFQLVAAVIRKLELNRQYVKPSNPYELALEFGLERMYLELCAHGQTDRLTHVVVEKRGSREDSQMELVFRRICDGVNALGKKLPFELVMVPKTANSTGLQIADLVARPIGINVLRPQQPNQAYDIVREKIRQSAGGITKGWGLKVFP